MKNKAIALISGGLDSLLAARVIKEQGIDVQGVCFVMPFASKDIKAFKDKVSGTAHEAGIQVKFVDISEKFLKMIKNPKYGYGANFNPCIDCKILMIRTAGNMLKNEDARFVVTGEVLGERPMSQRRDALDIIKRDSGLKGLLLRPLCAKLMEETLPEKEKVVDRNRLFDIKGRSRQPQFELAEKYGIKRFFTPAGGCLLTDPIFSKRLEDLADKKEMNEDNILLLKTGRHFRLDRGSKTVIGRNERENDRIMALKKDDDLIFRLKYAAGPYGLLRGCTGDDNIRTTASLVVAHSKMRVSENVEVEFWNGPKTERTILSGPLDKDKIEELRV